MQSILFSIYRVYCSAYAEYMYTGQYYAEYTVNLREELGYCLAQKDPCLKDSYPVPIFLSQV